MAILFLVGDRNPPRYGLTWRVWSRGTSFYVKTRERGLAETKVSLHGPDPRHARPGFKFGDDASVTTRLAATVNTSDQPLPWWFSGKPETRTLTHAIRICVRSETLLPGMPRGGDPGNVRAGMRAGLLQAPPEGSSALLDLYVSDGPLDLPNREMFEKLNAVQGPISNDAGQQLVGITRILRTERLTFPPLPSPIPDPVGPDDAVRGVQAGITEDGVLWLIERVLSRRWLVQSAERSDGFPRSDVID